MQLGCRSPQPGMGPGFSQLKASLNVLAHSCWFFCEQNNFINYRVERREVSTNDPWASRIPWTLQSQGKTKCEKMNLRKKQVSAVQRTRPYRVRGTKGTERKKPSYWHSQDEISGMLFKLSCVEHPSSPIPKCWNAAQRWWTTLVSHEPREAGKSARFHTSGAKLSL